MALTSVRRSVSALPGENYLINGNFDLWQRSTSVSNPTTSNEYATADRWRVRRAGNASCAVGHTYVVPDGSHEALLLTRYEGDTDTSRFVVFQQIESFYARPLCGRYITLSFKIHCKDDWVTNWDYADALVVCGSDEDPLVSVLSYGLTNETELINTEIPKPVADSYTEYTFTSTVRVPSTAQTILVRLSFTPKGTAGAEENLRLAQVKLEPGSIVTPFVPRLYGIEKMLCQRYYEKSFGLDIVPQNYTAANNVYDNVNSSSLGKSVAITGIGAACGQIAFSVSKRVRPAIIFYGNSSGQWINETQTGISLAVYSTIGNGLSAFTPVNTGGTTWNYLRGHWTADAEL